jgi:hypothetical protein
MADPFRRVRCLLRAAKCGDAAPLKQANNILRYYGLRAVRPGKTLRRYWSAAEDALLCEHFPHETTAMTARRIGCSVQRVNNRAHRLELRKSAEYLATPDSGRLLRGIRRSPGTEFRKGQVPFNKGMRRPGWSPGRMRETQFKKGRPAHESRNYLPIGSERLSKDGYLERKVTDDPAIVPARRWVAVHRLVWEATHGPIPPGHVVVLIPGHRTNVRDEITIDRLELITRVELMRRNTLHRYPKEVAMLIQLRGALNRKINQKRRTEPQDQPEGSEVNNDIGELRGLLFDTLRAVKDGSMELDRAKAVSDLSQTIINTAKAETDHMRASGRVIDSGFIPSERLALQKPRGPDLPAPERTARESTGGLIGSIGGTRKTT